MSDQEQLALARRLILDKRYGEAREILNKLEHPTAKAWLIKLDEIQPETRPPQRIETVPTPPATTQTEIHPEVRQSEEGEAAHMPATEAQIEMKQNLPMPWSDFATYVTLALVAMALVLITYGMFLRPNSGTAAASEIASAFQPTLDNLRLAVRSLEGLQGGSASSAGSRQQWEYLAVQYNQHTTMDTSEPFEYVSSSDPEYDRRIFGNVMCTSFGFNSADLRDCISKFRGLAYYLNLWGNDGWELVNANDKSSEYAFSLELIFKRPR